MECNYNWKVAIEISFVNVFACCVGLKHRMGLKIPERCQPKQPSWLDNRSSLWGHQS